MKYLFSHSDEYIFYLGSIREIWMALLPTMNFNKDGEKK